MTKLYEIRKTSDLPKKHREFIKEYARLGCEFKAYAAVGYKDTTSARRRARDLRKKLDPHIRAEVASRLQATDRVVLALNVVEELAKDSDVSAAVRLGAAKDIMAKAGLEEAQKVQVEDTKELSDAELLRRIEALSDKMKLVAND